MTTGSILDMARILVARRSRQFSEAWATEGYRGLVDRARSKAADWIRPRNVSWPIRRQDVIAADITRPPLVRQLKIAPDEPLVVNWVMSAAGPGSGGHTTIFRTIKYLQEQGYKNRVYFFERSDGDLKFYERLAREHYGATCEIGDARAGMSDAHAVVATAWPSAYVAYNTRCAGKRFYFVQDFEPAFYPAGTYNVLAENTYRMGFHGITAGSWLSEKLAREFGMQTDHFPFGCDTAHYRRDAGSKRSGVAFYARIGTPRRAVELGIIALELFAKRNPSVDLHFFGEQIGRLPFKFVDHGVATPSKLNEIYNRCFAGLSLSMTNVSLVPYEMLASGCIPITNDADHNRMVLANDHIRYAPATPHAIATALEAVMRMPNFDTASAAGAMSVAQASWDDAGAAVDAALRRGLGLTI